MEEARHRCLRRLPCKQRIQLGTAIIGVFNRHPAVIAMESATLDELSGGRFNLGIGVNVSSLVKHGYTKDAKSARTQKPFAAMKDSVEIIRGLLSGRNVVYQGEVFSLPETGELTQLSRIQGPEAESTYLSREQEPQDS